jgi:hypothetical protein
MKPVRSCALGLETEEATWVRVSKSDRKQNRKRDRDGTNKEAIQEKETGEGVKEQAVVEQLKRQEDRDRRGTRKGKGY